MAHPHTFKLALTAVICGAVAAPAFSSTAGTAKRTPERFEGTCEMSGVIIHQPPMTQRTAATQVRGSFTGVCSGKLTDRRGRLRRLDGALARYEARGAGELSCLGGTAPGTGRLLFGRGRSIGFRLTEVRTPGLAVVALRGAAGGSGTVRGTARAEDLTEIGERCGGSGLRVLRGDARITTTGISG